MECFRYGPGAPRRRRYWRPWRPALWVRRAGPADAPGRPGAVFSPLQFPLCLVMASEDLPACRPVERPCGPLGSGRGHVLRGAPVRSLPFLCPLCSLRPLRSPDRTGRTPGTYARDARGAAAPSPTAVSGPTRFGAHPGLPAPAPPAFSPPAGRVPLIAPRAPRAAQGRFGPLGGLWGVSGASRAAQGALAAPQGTLGRTHPPLWPSPLLWPSRSF